MNKINFPGFMFQIKHKFLPLFFLLPALLLQLSCNVDKCKTVSCYNGGYCQLGTCYCVDGYEGPTCQQLSRTKFLGNWMVFEKGNGSLAAQYPITIDTIGTNFITQVRILNFNDSFQYNDSIKSPVYANINNYNITIPNQQLQGKFVFGKGYIYSAPGVNYNQYNIINMQYEVIDSATGAIDDYGYDSAVDSTKPSVWNKQ
jgi:hypothetical protein